MKGDTGLGEEMSGLESLFNKEAFKFDSFGCAGRERPNPIGGFDPVS